MGEFTLRLLGTLYLQRYVVNKNNDFIMNTYFSSLIINEAKMLRFKVNSHCKVEQQLKRRFNYIRLLIAFVLFVYLK